jgi:carbamoyl-phosphate synthase small subunit
MTGYEEILTDPSYKGQIVVFTYPLIGNYGITREDFQSKDIKAEGIVIRELSRVYSNFRAKKGLADFLDEQNIFGIDGLDTRALTKQLREKGALKGGITTKDIAPEDFVKLINTSNSISDFDVYKSVINNNVITFEGDPNQPKKILAVDFGIKSNIIEELKKYFNTIYLVPFDDNFENNLANLEFDGIFLSNGPGDPRTVNDIEKYIKKFAENKMPIIAICFGHQLIGRSFGFDVIKLPFGHHGGNHPVKYMPQGNVYITAQNHNYAVELGSLNNNKDWELTWVNLFDNSVEGMKHKFLPINSVQFHPEASPGPNEANLKVFQDFADTVNNA